MEQALQLLPEVETLSPLRAGVVSTSDDAARGGVQGTLDKRVVRLSALRDLTPLAAARAAERVRDMFEASLEILGAAEEGDGEGVVRGLLGAGEREERSGRLDEAIQWYERAARAASGLRDRTHEMRVLLRFGGAQAAHGRPDEARRTLRNCLALAEAESDAPNAAAACLGLGDVSLSVGDWDAAARWYRSGLLHATEVPRIAAYLKLGLADAARGRNNLAVAGGFLRRAGEAFLSLADQQGYARVLASDAIIASHRGRWSEARETFERALSLVREAPECPALELDLRIHMARVLLEWGRLGEAEDEMRHAEERAILLGLPRHLARVYIALGELRRRQLNATGFVFFEKALELCRGPEGLPRLEGDAYLGYGLFRSALGDHEEAMAYFFRARELIETVGDGPVLERIDHEVSRLTRSEVLSSPEP